MSQNKFFCPYIYQWHTDFKQQTNVLDYKT